MTCHCANRRVCKVTGIATRFASTPRMKTMVDRAQPVSVDVRVMLGRANVGVA